MSDYLARVRTFSRDARLYLVSTVLSGLGLGIQNLLFNLFLLRLGYDQAFVGAVASVSAFAVAGTAVPIGLFLPRIGYKRGLLLGTALQGLAFVGQVAFPARIPLLLSSALFGLGSSLLYVASSPFLAASSGPAERTHLFSVQFALSTLASVVANLAGGALPRLLGLSLSGSEVYRATLALAAGIALLALLPIALLRNARQSPEGRPALEGLGGSRPTVAKLVLIEVIVALGAGLLIPFVNVFYKVRFDVADPLLGLLFASSSVLIALGSLAIPLLVHRLGKVRTIVALQALSIPFLFLMGFSPFFAFSAVGYLVRTALMNVSSPASGALSMELVSERLRPVTSSLLVLAWNGAWAVSALLSGRLQMTVGFPTIFLVTTSLYALVPTLRYAFFRHVREARSGEEIA